MSGYTNFQRLVHGVPRGIGTALLGGRGNGKTKGIAQGIGIKADRFGRKARILFLRQGPYKSLSDVIQTLEGEFNERWGVGTHSLSKSSWQWTLPTGTYFELGILPDGEEGRKYYEKTYQGRSFTDLYVDEAQQWARPDVIDLVVSNLRGEIPTSMTIAANPGGLGHQWLAQRHINTGVPPFRRYHRKQNVRLPDGKMFEVEREWVTCPGTYLDNPHNGADYLANLAVSCGHDIELLQAWISGNWSIARGAYFAAVLDNAFTRINWPDPSEWDTWEADDWSFWLAYDHGTASPAACYVIGKSPGAIGPDGRYYPAGSLLLLDEYVCHRENDLSSAPGWTIPQLATPIKNLAARWQIPASGVADDACFGETGQTQTIAREFHQYGVTWRRARKGLRAPRFQRMKTFLSNCGKIDEPGLYVSERCKYWWDTVPFLIHDPDDREVPLKCSTDHGLDASSYGMDGAQAGAGVAENMD